jgi:diaminohydroxyphosphoribosylaminopyrimidine deaminase/5-amino-6-(5-phosphoribosylamino)uracil reductase
LFVSKPYVFAKQRYPRLTQAIASMTDHSADGSFLRRALDLARQGIALASPNPCVGAVIVDAENNIVGTGVYTYEGRKHAEVRALEHAGEKARGATLYINLEPCSHQGRTPPCADAVIAAGIRRVVASMPDPNPQVSGRGFEKLKTAGIRVEVGLFENEARRLNENFARYIRQGIPLVTLKTAMTLDGKIASPVKSSAHPTGSSSRDWITGEAARAHVQKLRHQHDAILVGVGTILTDDPLLTDRSGLSRRRPLLRTILDSRLRLPMESRVVQSPNDGGSGNDVLIFCSSADATGKARLEERGVRVEQAAATPDGRPDLHAVLRRLGELEITSVLIEGGARINGSALANGVVDKILFYYAPTILASSTSIPFSTNADSDQLSGALQVKSPQLHRFGDDFAVEGYLRDPYTD